MFPLYTPEYVTAELEARYGTRAPHPVGSVVAMLRSLRRERRADRGLPVTR